MRIIALAACACLLAACGSDNTNDTVMASTSSSSGGSWYWPFGGGSDDAASSTPQLGVNGYLWRATLDTLNFMPLASADPVGGIVISDWYAAPDKPDEHMKVTVYILDTRLRADGLTVTVFKQLKGADGQWKDSDTSAQTQVDFENAILTKARQLRLSNIR